MISAPESSITDYLKLVRPYISHQLISPDTWYNINTLAQILPRDITSFFGFECHLGVKEARADFLICADAAEAGRKILAGDNYYITLPSFLMEHPVWSNICEFSTNWDTNTSPMYEKVRNVWLEFDINGLPNTIPIPSFFFGPEPLYSAQSDNPQAYEWVSHALKLLMGRTLPDKLEHQLFNCFDLLPREAYVFQIGVMLARKSELVRICIRNISLEQILDYLIQINWQGCVSELKPILTKLSSLVERIDLDIDVGEVISPKIGWECYLGKQPKFEPRWHSFLNFLGERGLCIPQKQDALLAYPGCLRERSNQELWPSGLLKLSNFLGAEYERVFFRGLHHVKVVYQPHKLDVKAYLYASYSLLNPQFISQWRKLQHARV